MPYPTSLDSFTPNVDNVDVIYAADINELQDSIEALEAKVGVDSSAVTSSHDYKLGEVTSTDKAVGKTATQTVANKTLGTGTKVAIGSDADKDMYYRASDGTLTRIPVGTDNQILKLNGTTPNWEAETTTVDASATVKGVVELATAAEITAGTATGGTGAALAVTPDQLAASTPTFSGLGITNSIRMIRLAGYSPASNTTENTVWSTTITGGVLSTNGVIKAQTPLYFVSTATAETWTVRLKFGGTTLLTTTFQSNAVGGGSAIDDQGIITAWIINNASQSSQNVTLHYSGGVNMSAASNQTPTSWANVADTTSTIDTSSNQTLTMTVQRTNGAGGSASFKQTLIETIKNV